MCWANTHTFTSGATTTADPMPLSQRCECGAISRADTEREQISRAEFARFVQEAQDMRRERDDALAEIARLRAIEAAAQSYRDAMTESITVCGNPERCDRARHALFALLTT